MATTTVVTAGAPQQTTTINPVAVTASTVEAPQGLAAIPDTIQPPRTNALGLEGIIEFGAQPNEFFNNNTDATVACPASTLLEALRTAVNSFFDRDSAVAAFELLPTDVQYEIKEEMWLLAGEDIDPANPQPHDRDIADDWSGRVIRNEVQVAGEEGPRADIQRYADITEPNSLFRRALDIVIAASPIQSPQIDALAAMD